MNTTVILVIVGIVGIIIGWILAKIANGQQSEEISKLKNELQSAEKKLKEQVEHFEASENIIHKLATDFKELYVHMKENDHSKLEEKVKGLIIDSENIAGNIAHKIVEEAKTIEEEINDVINETAEKIASETEMQHKDASADDENKDVKENDSSDKTTEEEKHEDETVEAIHETDESNEKEIEKAQ